MQRMSIRNFGTRTFFSSGFVTESASLLRAFRICEAATLVEVFSKAWSSVRSAIVVDLESKMPSRGCLLLKRAVAWLVAFASDMVGDTRGGHRVERTKMGGKTSSLRNPLRRADCFSGLNRKSQVLEGLEGWVSSGLASALFALLCRHRLLQSKTDGAASPQNYLK